MRTLLYTCITNQFDRFPHPNVSTNGFDYIYFSDNTAVDLPGNWQAQKATGKDKATAMDYKWVPPAQVWDKYPQSIWINGNIHIKCDLSYVLKLAGDADMLILNHSPNYAGTGVVFRKHTTAVRNLCKDAAATTTPNFTDLAKKHRVKLVLAGYDNFAPHFGRTNHLNLPPIVQNNGVQNVNNLNTEICTPINFLKHAKAAGIQIKGVIVVGAHHGEEYNDFILAGAKNILFIEPQKSNFDILSQKFEHKQGVKLQNIALGDKNGKAKLNLSTGNQGQSSSLLQPAKHLQEHPSIKFEGTETVTVKTLDSLKLNPADYNMLYMDAQGYEGKILNGAVKFLNSMDLVYTEVNQDEVYKDCAQVQEIDTMLQNFERIETKWLSKSWGDAVYIRKTNMVIVPDKFRPHMVHDYPTGNSITFEEWFFTQPQHRNIAGRTYLPVFWTSYYVNHNHGKDEKAIADLQQWLNTLDKSKKYYTIVQFDDGILNNITHLDLKVFSSSPKGNDYPLPLMGLHTQINFAATQTNLTANFIGKITHPLREKLIAVCDDKDGYYISVAKHEFMNYMQIIAGSTFTLCPRGYGINSFRITEALSIGSIPVYISDEFCYPHNLDFEQYGVVINEKQVKDIPKILAAITPAEITAKRKKIAELYQTHFTYAGVRDIIVDVVKGEPSLRASAKQSVKSIPESKEKIASGRKPLAMTKPDNRKISLCITNYNRTDLLFEALEYPLTDKRIDEIIISDDCSTDEVFKEVKKFCKLHKKIKLLRNPVNVGMLQNKFAAVDSAKNKWCILFDSDNKMTREYVDALFAREKWEPKTIYCPEYAEPEFNFTDFSGKQYDIVGVKNNLSKPLFRVMLNCCNYFVNRDTYAKVWQNDFSIKGSDTIFFNYLWLAKGYSFFVVPGMRYMHRVHDGSGFKEDMDLNMKKAGETLELIKEL